MDVWLLLRAKLLSKSAFFRILMIFCLAAGVSSQAFSFVETPSYHSDNSFGCDPIPWNNGVQNVPEIGVGVCDLDGGLAISDIGYEMPTPATFSIRTRSCGWLACNQGLPYAVAINQTGNNDNSYYLELGEHRLPITLALTGNSISGSYALSNSEYAGAKADENLTIDGRGRRSQGNGVFNNLEIVVTLDNNSLDSLPSGQYSGSFTFSLYQQDRSDRTWDGSFLREEFTITATLVDQVLISELDDVVLEGSDIAYSAEEEFCVYSRSGQYSILAEGSNVNNQDPSQFWLSQSGSNVGTPYSLSLIAGGAVSGLLRGQKSHLIPTSTDRNCSGGVKPRILPIVRNEAVRGLPAGVYTDVLTLTVTPD